MKNCLKILCLLCLPLFAYSQGNYQEELKKINDYFKTFDNGYYGYFEVKNGNLYDRFKSGEYSRVAMDKLGQASEYESGKKVIISCIDTAGCVYSTYTGQYHTYMQFSQSDNFNTGELVNLFNKFISAYKGKTTTNSSPQNSAAAEREKNLRERPKSDAELSGPLKYKKQLDALNAYLKTFNPDVYGEVVVSGSKVFFYFKVSGTEYYSSVDIDELVNNTTVIKVPPTGYSSEEVKISCHGDSKCFYSSYLKGKTDHFRFYSNSVKDLFKMQQLVKDFIAALKSP